MFALRASQKTARKILMVTLNLSTGRWVKLSSDKQAQSSLSHRVYERNDELFFRYKHRRQFIHTFFLCRRNELEINLQYHTVIIVARHVSKFRVYHVKNSLANWVRFMSKLSQILPSLAYMFRRRNTIKGMSLTSGKYERIRGIGINVQLWWRRVWKSILSLSTKTQTNAG